MAAEQLARARLLGTDWAALCRSERFCFACQSPVCSHCCRHHGHRARHHPQERVDPLLVEMIGGRLAIDSIRAVGCGYDLKGIQRIKSGGRNYVLLLSVEENDLRCHAACQSCQFQIKRGSNWCSLQCKLFAVPGGNRREAAERLIQLAAGGLFGQPVMVKDRFCYVCRDAFSSASCPDPLHGHAGAAPDAVKTVLHFNGWAAVPDGQLPVDFVANVQVLQNPFDGNAAYAIHRRAAQDIALGLELDLGLQPPHACGRAGCHEAFGGPREFCSLRCNHQA